jgi:hypothetical protein
LLPRLTPLRTGRRARSAARRRQVGGGATSTAARDFFHASSVSSVSSAVVQTPRASFGSTSEYAIAARSARLS